MAGLLRPEEPHKRRREATPEEALRREHEFVRDEERDLARGGAWEVRLAARYHAKLHKEYAIIDLSKWQKGLFGLRWRTEAEVLEGIGVEVCGAKRCENRLSLQSYEVPFAYEEKGQAKTELVKVRLCAACATKLNHISSHKKKKKRDSSSHKSRRKRSS